MFATGNLNTRATDDLAVRGSGFKVEAETGVYTSKSDWLKM